MRPGWIIGLTIAFLLLHLVNGICEMTFVTGEPETVFNEVIEQVGVISESSNVGEAIWNSFWLGGQIFVLFVTKLFWFDYAYLQGNWIFLRFIYMAISLGIILGLVLASRGTSSS